MIRCLATGVGAAFDIVINTDSGEARGAVNRRDVGKLRHKRTQELRPAERYLKPRFDSAKGARREERCRHSHEERECRRTQHEWNPPEEHGKRLTTRQVASSTALDMSSQVETAMWLSVRQCSD